MVEANGINERAEKQHVRCFCNRTNSIRSENTCMRIDALLHTCIHALAYNKHRATIAFQIDSAAYVACQPRTIAVDETFLRVRVDLRRKCTYKRTNTHTNSRLHRNANTSCDFPGVFLCPHAYYAFVFIIINTILKRRIKKNKKITDT